MAAMIIKAQRQLSKIDTSKAFQGIVIAVILLSALMIGAKTHNLSANVVAELLFLDVAVFLCFRIWFLDFGVFDLLLSNLIDF